MSIFEKNLAALNDDGLKAALWSIKFSRFRILQGAHALDVNVLDTGGGGNSTPTPKRS